jgi:hypothetical protein
MTSVQPMSQSTDPILFIAPGSPAPQQVWYTHLFNAFAFTDCYTYHGFIQDMLSPKAPQMLDSMDSFDLDTALQVNHPISHILSIPF